tara:strand:+ start:3324 stop:3926 length:603 start_codon:yes stop_codon:yes gene_type:complete
MTQSSKYNSVQRKKFYFSQPLMDKAKKIIAQYPEGRERSAILPLLEMAQRHNGGWLSPDALEYVGDMLSLPITRVWEIATFYTMFNTQPVGKFHIQVCGTPPCYLCGSKEVKRACQKWLGIKVGETTDDKMFTLTEVECLGACANAPVVQINDDYFEDLNAESIEKILQDLADGKKIESGSMTGRTGSAPLNTKIRKKDA